MSIVLRKPVSPQGHQQQAAGQLGEQVPQPLQPSPGSPKLQGFIHKGGKSGEASQKSGDKKSRLRQKMPPCMSAPQATWQSGRRVPAKKT